MTCEVARDGSSDNRRIVSSVATSQH